MASPVSRRESARRKMPARWAQRAISSISPAATAQSSLSATTGSSPPSIVSSAASSRARRTSRFGVAACPDPLGHQEHVAGVKLACHLVDGNPKAELLEVGAQLRHRAKLHPRAAVPAELDRRLLDEAGPARAARARAIALPHQEAAVLRQRRATAFEERALLRRLVIM